MFVFEEEPHHDFSSAGVVLVEPEGHHVALRVHVTCAVPVVEVQSGEVDGFVLQQTVCQSQSGRVRPAQRRFTWTSDKMSKQPIFI